MKLDQTELARERRKQRRLEALGSQDPHCGTETPRSASISCRCPIGLSAYGGAAKRNDRIFRVIHLDLQAILRIQAVAMIDAHTHFP